MAVALPSNSNIPILPSDVMGIIINYAEEPGDIIAWMQVSKAIKAIAEPLLPSRMAIPNQYEQVKEITHKISSKIEYFDYAAAKDELAYLKSFYKQRCAAMNIVYGIFGGKDAFMTLPIHDATDAMHPRDILYSLTAPITRGSYGNSTFIGICDQPGPYELNPDGHRQLLIEAPRGSWEYHEINPRSSESCISHGVVIANSEVIAHVTNQIATIRQQALETNQKR